MNQISSSEVPDLFRLYNNLYKLEMFTELLQNFHSTYTGRNKSMAKTGYIYTQNI